MSFESLMAASHRFSVSVEALAALGAELRLRQEGLDGDPRVRALLHDVVNAVDPLLLGGIDADREAMVLALIQTRCRGDSSTAPNQPPRHGPLRPRDRRGKERR